MQYSSSGDRRRRSLWRGWLLIALLAVLGTLGRPSHAQAVASGADLPRLGQQWVDREVLVQQATHTEARLHMDGQVGALDARLRLAPCARVEFYMPPGSRLWGNTRVGARCLEGPVRWNVFLPAAVRVMGRAWVLRRDLAVGAPIEMSDVEETEVDWAADASQVLTGAQGWQGFVALRQLQAGQVLRQSMVRPAQVFQAGTEVRVLVDGGGFQISTLGLALSAGVVGQEARIKMESGRILSGKVLDAHTVRADI